jgi:Domain of unknown function (DUF4132)
MLEWLKGKVKQGLETGQKVLLAKAVSVHFAPLENAKGGIPGIAGRLAQFVVEGEDQASVSDLAAHKSRPGIVYFSGGERQFSQGLAKLLTLLPEDPELYLRLALAYEAASQTAYSSQYSPIPGFGAAHRWLYAFLAELANAGPKNDKYFSADLVEAMIVAKQEDPSILVKGAMIVQDQQGKNKFSRWVAPPYNYFRCLRGFPEVALRFHDIVIEGLHQTEASARAYTLSALAALDVPVTMFREDIATLAISGSKEVREKAAPIVERQFPLFQPLLEHSAGTGNSDERYHSARLLARIGGDGERTFLTQRLEVEKAAKVCDAIRELLSDSRSSESSGQATTPEGFGLQPIPDIPVRAPLEKQVLVDLHTTLDDFERRASEEFARNKWAQQQKKTRTPVSSDTADKLFDALQNFVVEEGKTWQFVDLTYAWASGQNLKRFAAHPQFELIHLVRWCLLLSGRAKHVNAAHSRQWGLTYHWKESFLSYQKARRTPIDLRQLAAVFRVIGLDELIIGEQLLRETSYARTPYLRTDPNCIWPYFAERLDLLEEVFGLKQVVEERAAIYVREKDHRQNAFGILKLFPQLPAKFVPLLWDIALGPSKTERPLAQECLDKVPNKEEKILAAVASRQQDARLAAAEWLANLNFKPAIPALRTALSKEKSEPVKDEIIRALETLGVGLDELLDLNKLDKEAENGLKKGMPGDLEWFPFAQLPAVRWNDSEKQVRAEIVQWFLIQGFRLKDAEANPTLRRYCSLFQKGDREKLGKFVLEAWIAKDTKPKYTSEQAAALAQKEAAQAAGHAKQYPQYYPDFDEQKYYQTAFNRLLVQPEGSQTSTRGILAVAGACCGGDAAPIVHRYIKQWYGYRPAQGKALLQVLAWIDHPSATQVVLSVANRFRTKGIQEEAMRLCQLLADRKGWTLDELADRTIPTASLDDDGAMELDYGSRVFTARLSEEMTIALTNQSGKTILSLPDANQSDDPEKFKQAKSALSAARKELKSVLTMQKDRLYEALCTQRSWRFEEWDRHLRKHPIVGRYCQRLVWVVCDGETVSRSFRPLPDGTLTDHQDDEVSLGAGATIRLGHEETLLPQDRTAWVQHFSDYKVEPLFQQFGKQTFTLPPRMKETGEITEFMGHIVKAFSLRNRLTRLGYTRGAAQDGGWFFDYHKNFSRLGLAAVIEFTGNGLPEENRTVALQRLYFARKTGDGGASIPEEVTLGELPRVLLSECWNDLRMAAAEGSGFAQDWEKQTEF